MLEFTEAHREYPGNNRTQRADVLKTLEGLHAQTKDSLDGLSLSLRVDPSLDCLSQEEVYMFRQRLLCALDFLSRLADTLPTPDFLSTSSSSLELEDQWILVGIWNEFGPFWIQNLAWRLSQGADE